MIKKGMTIKEAAAEWVNGFNAVPYAVCEKLLKANECELEEITPIAKNDRVYILSGKFDGQYGEVCEVGEDEDGETVYTVSIDGEAGCVDYKAEDLEVERDGYLPMWGTLWAFGDGIDNWWLEEGGLQLMADCGFRIYEQEDYEYLFGIDGAGYDFYEAHWIPLYRARGLHWHDETTEKVSA